MVNFRYLLDRSWNFMGCQQTYCDIYMQLKLAIQYESVIWYGRVHGFMISSFSRR